MQARFVVPYVFGALCATAMVLKAHADPVFASAAAIAPDVDWECVDSNSETYSMLLEYLDGALFHGSLQLSSRPGLWKSTDNGVNWTRTWKDGSRPIFDIVSNGSHYFLATSGGVYRSERQDDEWTRTSSSLSGNSSPVTIIAIGDTIVAASQNGKIQRSTDNGDTWSNVHGTFSDADLYGDLSLMLSLTRHKGYLFLCSSLKGVARSPDNGATWEPGRGDIPVTSTPPLLSGNDLASTTNTLYAIVGGKLYSSTNRGDTWAEEMDERMLAVHSLDEDVVVAGENGVWALNAGSTDWVSITRNLDLPASIHSMLLAVGGGNLFLAINSQGDVTPTLWRRPIGSTGVIVQRNTASTQQAIGKRAVGAHFGYNLRGRLAPRRSSGAGANSSVEARGLFIVRGENGRTFKMVGLDRF